MMKYLKKENTVVWECRNCEYIVEGKSAPEICPVCKYPKAYFEIKAKKLLKIYL
ncbi:rubredoxin-like domain-containing protein [Methanobrevibacter arboriphilus]|nr:hypothetical protein [Methanobrevibacter arboriphilus]